MKFYTEFNAKCNRDSTSIIMTVSAVILSGIISALVISACGTGNDPVVVLGDPSVTPTLALPFSTNVTVGTPTYYTSANPTFQWTFSTNTSISITSPSAGLITAVDTTPELASVTIQHTPRFSTRLRKMGTVIGKVGDFIAQGSPVGVMGTGLQLEMTFYRDGATICPYTYFTGDSLNYINTRTSGYLPCGI